MNTEPKIDPLDVPFKKVTTWELIDVGPNKFCGNIVADRPRTLLLGAVPHFPSDLKDKVAIFIDDVEGSVVIGEDVVGKLKARTKPL